MEGLFVGGLVGLVIGIISLFVTKNHEEK